MIAILSGNDEAAAKSVVLSFTNPMTKSSTVNLTMVLSPNERDSYAFMESYNQMAEAIGDDVTYDFKFNIYSCPNCMADVKSNNCVDTDGLYCKFANGGGKTIVKASAAQACFIQALMERNDFFAFA